MQTNVSACCTKPGHNKGICGICTEKNCKEIKLCCMKCIISDHSSHSNKIILIEDLPEELKNIKSFYSDRLNQNIFVEKIQHYFENVKTRMFDELDKLMNKIITNYQDSLNIDGNNFNDLLDKYIQNHLYKKLKREYENNSSSPHLNSIIEELIVNETNSNKSEEELKKMIRNQTFILPHEEEKDRKIKKIIEQIESLENIFVNNLSIDNFFIQKGSEQLLYNYEENSYFTTSQNLNLVLLSEKKLFNNLAHLKFQVETLFSHNSSGFGLIDESLIYSGMWPEKTNSCYFNISSLTYSNMKCDKNISSLCNVFKNNQTMIYLEIDAGKDYFSIKIEDYIITKLDSFSIKNRHFRVFFFFFYNGMQKVKFLNF
jgi:hypothetical protein